MVDFTQMESDDPSSAPSPSPSPSPAPSIHSIPSIIDLNIRDQAVRLHDVRKQIASLQKEADDLRDAILGAELTDGAHFLGGCHLTIREQKRRTIRMESFERFLSDHRLDPALGEPYVSESASRVLSVKLQEPEDG